MRPRFDPSANGGVRAAPSAATAERLLGAVPKRGARREFVVGLFLIFAVATTLFALLTFTDSAMFRGRYVVTTRVADAGGLRRGDPVRMRGVTIGRIQRFAIRPEGVDVRLEIEGEFRIPADSRVVLRSAGLLSGMVADVLPGHSPAVVSAGDAIPGTTGTDLSALGEDLGRRADSTLLRVQALLSDRTVAAVGQGAVELEALLAQLSAATTSSRRDLQALAASLRRSAQELERATGDGRIERVVGRTDSAVAHVDDAARSLARASAALAEILARTERGEGSLGRFTRDDRLYEELTRAAQNVALLAEDVRRNPGRYVRVKLF